VGFWKWYDRAARADFFGNLVGLFFDWRAWLLAAIGGGSGGVMTFFWSAVDGRSPLDVWLMSLIAAACIAIIIIAVMAIVLAFRKRDFEFLFDSSDSRYVEKRGDKIRYCVGLHNLTHRTLPLFSVRTDITPFTTVALPERDPFKWGRPVGQKFIYQGGAIDPDGTDLIDLFELPAIPRFSEADLLSKPHTFVLDARAQDAIGIRTRFRYDPRSNPALKKL
jgi:hypothetical protein